MSGLSGESVVGAGRLFIAVYGYDAIQLYRQARCAGLQHQIRVLAELTMDVKNYARPDVEIAR